jgi:hypothetical protein
MVLKIVEAIGEMFFQPICSVSQHERGLWRGNACLLLCRILARSFCRLVSCRNSHADIGDGSFGLFISNTATDVPSESGRALRGSSLFGMFALNEGKVQTKHFYKL